MKIWKKIGIAAALSLALMAGSCEQKVTADTKEAAATAQLTAEASAQVGAPNIVNFTEKRAVKMLYELRDDPNFRTYSYWTTMDGRYIFICDSIGYPVSASIQYTNSQKVVDYRDFLGTMDRYPGTLPQPEPNALFTPDGLAATYVLCKVPGKDKIHPVYVEQEVMTSPFPMTNATP